MDLPAANHRPIRPLLVEGRIRRPQAKRRNHDCEYSAQNTTRSIAFGGEIPAEQHQDGETDKESEHRGHGILDSESSNFDLVIIVACLVQPGNGNVLSYASFSTLVIADLSISIFTLSATFTSTVVSFTFEIRP